MSAQSQITTDRDGDREQIGTHSGPSCVERFDDSDMGYRLFVRREG